MAEERLEALKQLVNDVDAANPTHEQQQAQAAEAEALRQEEMGAKSWGMLMFTVGGFAQMIAPELKPLYTEDRCLTWGQHAQQVASKYGMGAPTAMPELALLASTISFVVPTYFAIREKFKDLKDAKAGGLSALAAWWRNRGKKEPPDGGK